MSPKEKNNLEKELRLKFDGELDERLDTIKDHREIKSNSEVLRLLISEEYWRIRDKLKDLELIQKG